jgi:hypothetical protein
MGEEDCPMLKRCVAIVLCLAFAASVRGAHPVRVNKSRDGWPHFFEVWDGNAYQPRVLKGYRNIWFGRERSKLIGRLDGYRRNKCDFIRMWMRPSDGFYAYRYDAARKQVDLDRWNEDFFQRIDWILDEAQAREIVVEVMLWDRCTGWRGGGLAKPTTWEDWKDGKNVHHPDNHYRSSAGNRPIPGLHTGDERRINNSQWYDTGNKTWMRYQMAYMQRVIAVVLDHDYASVTLINEAPPGANVLRWRMAMHDWMHAKWPDLMTSGEGLGDDDEMRQWAAKNPDHLDLVPTHKGDWSYDMAQRYYYKYKGVLPGINENISRNYNDLNSLRREAWGLTMAGGVVYNENYPDGHGSKVCRELHAFFYPAKDEPEFWKMRPHKEMVGGNRGHHYVLAKDDGSEILVFVDNEGGTGAFRVRGSGAYRYRWFKADGGGSAWGEWQNGDSWTFSPPGTNHGLQIRKP